jgi:hypothetical protein
METFFRFKKHYFGRSEEKWYEAEGSWWLYAGPVAFNFAILMGVWVSLGFHLSLVPPGLDLHIFWFQIGIMSKQRAREIWDAEEGYLET